MRKQQFSVLTYNIHKGFFIHPAAYVLEEIKQAIHSVRADLVFLQEIKAHHEIKLSRRRQKSEDREIQNQLEVIADTLWPYSAFGKNAAYSSGNHGNAILSVQPFSTWDNYDISTNQFEKRGVLHVTLERGPGLAPMHLFCLHLNLLEKGRKVQIRQFTREILEQVPHTAPVIIAGDFNDWRGRIERYFAGDLGLQEAHTVLRGEKAKTFPSWLPVLPLDRIYFSNVKVTACQVLRGRPWSRLSDHSAILAHFEQSFGWDNSADSQNEY